MEIRKMTSTQGLKQGAKQLFLLSVFFILSITLSGLASGQAVQENCSLNCVEIEISENKLATRVYNEAGKVLTSSVMNSGDGSVKLVFQETYVTASEIVIVKIYIYYDADGNIIDVKSVTTRFAKPMEK